MVWADAVPNLLIGLREGLEAGLVVSILLAAVHKLSTRGERVSTTPVWLGVLGAVMVAGGFATVLTYSTDVLSSRAQQAVGGVLSVLAVALVTWMVFWMRRTARSLSAQLRGDVARAMSLGAGALTVTAFFAVSREGLETTLFIWTAVKASASTVAPVIGAGIGLSAAVTLCWLLYRRAVRLNLGTFFNRTAVLLIVIAAGVLAYGVRDLQEAGWLPGQHWVAFDLASHVDPTSWWMSIITGVTELTPRMSVLQIVAWAVYLATVPAVFVTAGRAPSPAPAASVPAGEAVDEGATTPVGSPVTPPVPAGPGPSALAGPAGWWDRQVTRRAWPVATVMVVAPALVAGLVVALLPTSRATRVAVKVRDRQCGAGWTGGVAGAQTFAVTNSGSAAGDIELRNGAGAIVAEVETLGPSTTATMNATLGPGQYSFTCLIGGVTRHGAPVQVSGAGRGTTPGVLPVTVADLTGPNKTYQAYAARVLTRLAGEVATLRKDIAGGNLAAATRDWLAAQLDWEKVGASYNSFGAAGQAVDGLPDGLPQGVHDPGFTGLHRIEYGLYHGQGAAQLLPVADRLAKDVATVRARLTTPDEAGDPTTLTLRVHEILEDAQRDHLFGIDDQGSGMGYATTYADSQATRAVLGMVAGLLKPRMPTLVPTITTQLDELQAALRATQVRGAWQPMSTVPHAEKQRVNAAIGAVLESLSLEPTLLEVPPNRR